MKHIGLCNPRSFKTNLLEPKRIKEGTKTPKQAIIMNRENKTMLAIQEERCGFTVKKSNVFLIMEAIMEKTKGGNC